MYYSMLLCCSSTFFCNFNMTNHDAKMALQENFNKDNEFYNAQVDEYGVRIQHEDIRS